MCFNLEHDGFEILPSVLTDHEVGLILETISHVDISNPLFRRSTDLFAIRQFLKQAPTVAEILLNSALIRLLNGRFPGEYFIVKSIYFDKPAMSNWFVALHQDLSISVSKKIDVPGYRLWPVKHDQFGVQPPLRVLENVITARIHLDTTTLNNGALDVIPGSHKEGIIRVNTVDESQRRLVHCEVPQGGVMLMKPLLLHSSGRTTDGKQRRVIHIEFSSVDLDVPLEWAERLSIPGNA